MPLIKLNLDKNKILHIDLNNPEFANAFSPQAAEELLAGIRLYKSQNIKGILFSSVGSQFFCSGGNLQVYAELSKQDGIQANERITEILNELYAWSVPKACIVNGDAYGGGVELMSCFDRVFITPHSFIGLWQRKIALVYGWGGYQRLLKRVSEAVLRQAIMDAKNFTAYESCEHGFSDQVLSENEISLRALAWLTNQSKLSLRPVEALSELGNNNEVQVFNKLWHNEDHLKVLKKYKK